ncbi:GNAT family N-acetyltransferase [uncultured Enterovirga sp.]|uniref:GNAT family N-acetyltransferase n=1 Tax=uncultured Enterovirga sp. TaxID=2026352 RepID=UPI0035CB5517
MIDAALLARLRIEPLDRKRHDRAAFSCGVAQVDTYLRTVAAGLQDLETTRVYVARLDETPDIVGFYAVNAHAIDLGTLPEGMRKKLPRYPLVPAIYLSVVGVHDAFQGGGVGSVLMADAMRRCARVADEIGAAFIVLDALNERAGALYRRLGFVDLPGRAPRMVIGIRQVRAAIAAAAIRPA